MGTAIDQISVSEILRRVKKYGKLPEQGFLAGGAVANTILSIVDGTEYPVNDLDVFYDSKQTGHDIAVGNTIFTITDGKEYSIDDLDLCYHSQKPHFDEKEFLMPDRPCTMVVDIRYRPSIIAKDTYQVLMALRKGSINFLKIRMCASHPQNENLTILQGFDIDCCQAGIDLTTEQLFYTEAFRKFLNTRQVHVTMPVTPYQTAIRLVKKQDELNAYCNIAEEMSLLMHVPKLFFTKNRDTFYGPSQDPPIYAEFFGKRIYGIYKKYSAILDPYFAAVPYIKSVEHDIGDPRCNGEKSLLLPAPEQIMPLSEPGELYTLIPKFEILIDEDLKDVQCMAEFMPIWTSLKRGRKAQASKFRNAKKYFFTHLCSVVNPKYVHCDFHDKHLKRIHKFVSAHPPMSIVLYFLTIQQQLRAIRLIENLAAKYGMFVIGLIEQNFRNIGADTLTEQIIISLIDAYKRDYADLSVNPLDISGFRFQQFVREMTTVEELLEEGRRMHHCVGGYARALKEKSSRIFHIECNEESSTLELNTYYFLGLGSMYFSIRQHRGQWNKVVGIAHRKLGEDFKEFLNQKYGSKNMSGGSEQVQEELFAELL